MQARTHLSRLRLCRLSKLSQTIGTFGIKSILMHAFVPKDGRARKLSDLFLNLTITCYAPGLLLQRGTIMYSTTRMSAAQTGKVDVCQIVLATRSKVTSRVKWAARYSGTACC